MVAGWLLLLLAAVPAAPSVPRVLVVCPPAWRPALEPWAEHRRGQGFEVLFASPGETPEQNLALVRGAVDRGGLEAVLLVGEARAGGSPRVPTHYVRAEVNVRWGSEPEIATDLPLADPDADGRADLAVGRVPCRSAGEVAEYFGRVVRAETSLAPDLDDCRTTVVASPLRFSPLVDGLVETVAITTLTRAFPPPARLHATHADPTSRFYPGTGLPRSVEAGLRQRAACWVYMGHGHWDELDRCPGVAGPEALLSAARLSALPPGGESPRLALFLSCYAGALDSPGRSLAEALLMRPGGPLNVIAATRVSMPYGNAVLATSLLDRMRPASEAMGAAPPIGAMLRDARRSMVDTVDPAAGPAPPAPGVRQMIEGFASLIVPEGSLRAQERAEHAAMYNLLGDPLVRPVRVEPLEVACEAIDGRGFRVTGRSPLTGGATLELVRAVSAGSRVLEAGSDADRVRMHQRSNDVTLDSRELRVDAGRAFTVDFVEPAGGWPHGLRAYVRGGGRLAAGGLVLAAPRRGGANNVSRVHQHAEPDRGGTVGPAAN